ncbi:MAG: gamma carbonic anhydrase family protein [Alphaproteobacteria bacterium]|nr:gamma carbonic anhydrase family protein [Alphaproteobacteria bacterium]
MNAPTSSIFPRFAPTPGGILIPFRGKYPRVAPDAFVAPTAVLIGDVEVGPEAGIWFGCVLRADTNTIRIGARSNIQDGTIIHVNPGEAWATVIGEDVTVGHLCLIHAARLESGAFVGMKAAVIDGAVVEGGAMVAAGALVTPNKRVPSGELWAGSPAAFKRKISPEDARGFATTSVRYVEFARQYRAEGIGVTAAE